MICKKLKNNLYNFRKSVILNLKYLIFKSVPKAYTNFYDKKMELLKNSVTLKDK
jgi:hypothetical protein